jgi:hypothetical protein
VGWNGFRNITDSYSNGAVKGGIRVGGLVGHNSHGSIVNSYGTGPVTGTDDIGGLAGYHYHGSIAASLWDVETTGLLSMCGNHGDEATGCDDSYAKTTAEMQTASTYLDAGWDFIDETANGTEDIWWILEGQDYPRLWWELPEEAVEN